VFEPTQLRVVEYIFWATAAWMVFWVLATIVVNMVYRWDGWFLNGWGYF